MKEDLNINDFNVFTTLHRQTQIKTHYFFAKGRVVNLYGDGTLGGSVSGRELMLSSDFIITEQDASFTIIKTRRSPATALRLMSDHLASI
jgi:hypothetical protein